MTDWWFTGRKDNPWIQNSEGIERMLDQAEEVHDLGSIDIDEEASAKPAIAVLAGGSSAEPSYRGGHFLQQGSHIILPPGAIDLRQEVHMEMAIPGVTEHHDSHLSFARGFADRFDILAEPAERHASILDHLQRAPIGRESSQNRARRMTNRPEPLGLFGGRGSLDPLCPTFGGGDGAAQGSFQRIGIVRFQLDQKDCSCPGCKPSLRQCTRGQEIEKASVQQLNCRGAPLVQRRDDIAQVLERRQRDPEPSTMAGNSVEAPFDLGDDAERPLAANDEVERVGVAR